MEVDYSRIKDDLPLQKDQTLLRTDQRSPCSNHLSQYPGPQMNHTDSHDTAPANTCVWQEDLVHNARHLQGYRLSGEESDNQPILRGRLETTQLQPGLSLHLVDARIAQPFSFEARLEPCLKLSIVLRGNTTISYGNRTLDLGPGVGQSSSAHNTRASVIALNEDERCFHQARECDIRRSLTLSLSPEWLERQQLNLPGTRRFLARHLHTLDWHLPESLRLMAEQLFHGTLDDPASRLIREGFALTLAGYLIEQLEQSEQKPRPVCAETRRGRQLLELLDSGEADLLSMTDIGNRLGMSSATLQRCARQTLGTSLNAYLRQRRLEKAYHLLLHTDSSIAEAATLAGYAHTANFTTAFRRQFGVCPKTLKGHRN